jgi:hypothetical protein
MHGVYRDSDQARVAVTATLRRFLDSEDGARVAEAAGGLGSSAVLELRTVDPDCVVWIDFAGRSLIDEPEEPPAAVAAIEADSLHHLLLDQLGPVEISRLAEENRVALTGPPLVLGALLPVVAAVQPHYRPALEEAGIAELLDTPPPESGEVWVTDVAAPPVIGVRRPWQRPRSGRATGVA